MNQIYRRFVPKGSYAVYGGGIIEESSKRVNYNVMNRKGVTETYIMDCDSYPYCFYDEYTVEEKNLVKTVNKMAIYDKPVTKISGPLTEEKQVMVVHCKDDGNDNKGYCEVETSAYTQGKEVTLLEKEEFYKYVIKEEKGTFKLDLQSAVDIVRLSVDIMIFTGDVTFDIRNQDLSKEIEIGRAVQQECRD